MRRLLTFCFLFGVLGSVAFAEPEQATAPSEINGDVLYWEGDELVVKEITGYEKRVRVTPETKIVGVSARLKTGDKIAARVTSEGRAQTITLQIPDGAPALAPPAVR
jgi:hypothetical protein